MTSARWPIAAALEATGRTVSWLAETAPAPRLLGLIAFGDTLKPSAPGAIAALHAKDVRVAMLTGDNRGAAEAVARELGIDTVFAEVLPEGKAEAVARLRAEGGVVAMVGDGINDAPALAAADIGIAMATGTDVAMHAAGITLMRGDPALVAAALDIARRTQAKIREGLFWAFVYNVVGIPLAAFGLLSLTIISDAHSMPEVTSFRATTLSLRKARMPQWKSLVLTLKNILPTAVRKGLPRYLFKKGIAPGMIVPRRRLPRADVCSPAELFDQGHGLVEVVAVVAVSHQDVFAFGMLDAVLKRGAVPPRRTLDDARAQVPRDLFAAVDRTVVSNEDLSVNVIVREQRCRQLVRGAARYRPVTFSVESGLVKIRKVIVIGPRPMTSPSRSCAAEESRRPRRNVPLRLFRSSRTALPARMEIRAWRRDTAV